MWGWEQVAIILLKSVDGAEEKQETGILILREWHRLNRDRK